MCYITKVVYNMLYNTSQPSRCQLMSCFYQIRRMCKVSWRLLGNFHFNFIVRSLHQSLVPLATTCLTGLDGRCRWPQGVALMKIRKHLICTSPFWRLFVVVICMQPASAASVWAKTFIEWAWELPQIFSCWSSRLSTKTVWVPLMHVPTCIQHQQSGVCVILEITQITHTRVIFS